MRIRDRLQISFIVLALAFGVIGYFEHEQITEMASSFRSLEAQRAPALTALLEMIAATRRASIKAMEYSMRGNAKDRVKTQEALSQMDERLTQYRALAAGVEDADDQLLVASKQQFTDIVNSYLEITEGAAVAAVLGQQEDLHQRRSDLVAVINRIMSQLSEEQHYDLVLIKSEARKVSIKIVEYGLRGNASDREKALEAMNLLDTAEANFIAAADIDADSIENLAAAVGDYLDTSRNYLDSLSARRYAVDDMYQKEVELHAARKDLIQTLYPLIDRQYDVLEQAARATSVDIEQVGRLQTYSIVAVVLLAILIAVLLARSISSPLNQLAQLVSRFGKGESIKPEQIPTRGARELRELGGAVADMIRERETLHDSLQQSEAYLRTIINTLPDPVWVKDRDGVYLSFNRRFENSLGASETEIIGNTNYDFFDSDEADRFREQDREVMDSGKPKIYEEQVTFADDGHEELLETIKTPIFDSEGKVVGVLAVARDITERKQSERDREHLIEELEARNIELERFVYTVSHELKSPLVTIANFAGMLGKNVKTGDVERLENDIQRITSAVGTMSLLLDNLLEMSRLGRVVNTPEEIALDDLVRDVVEDASLQHADRDISLSVSLDLNKVFGDQVRLREVLQNLVENAIKFSGDQERIRVEIGSRDNGEEVVCYVRDNGRGIDPSYHEKIFGLFERLDPDVEGTGIGLALSHRIVELHGGRLWVESDGRGSGSTFLFALPKAA